MINTSLRSLARLALLATLLATSRPAAAHPQDEAAALLMLRVEDAGLRYEIDIPRSVLQQVTGWTLPATSPEVGEFVRGKFPAYFEGRNPVYVDGLEVAPRLREAGLVDASRNETAAPSEDPLVYVVLEYPSTRPPQKIDMVWTWTELFEKAGERIPAAHGNLVGVGPAKPVSFSGEKKLSSWKRPVATVKAADPAPVPGSCRTLECVALVALGLAMAGVWWLGRRSGRRGLAAVILLLLAVSGFLVLCSRRDPPAAEATRIFQQLIEDVYRSFDGRAEEDVHDLLASRIDGELLEKTWRQIQQGILPDHREKGAAVRILSIEGIEAEPIGWQAGLGAVPGFRVRARFRVRALVVHHDHAHAGQPGRAGHVHPKSQDVEAIYRIERRDGAWKLAGVDPVP